MTPLHDCHAHPKFTWSVVLELPTQRTYLQVSLACALCHRAFLFRPAPEWIRVDPDGHGLQIDITLGETAH